MEAASEARKAGVSVIADGGIKYSGDLAKAIAAERADVVMIGSLLARAPRSPAGKVYLYQGRSNSRAIAASVKISRMARAARPIAISSRMSRDALKLVPEGIEGQVPYLWTGRSDVLHQLLRRVAPRRGLCRRGPPSPNSSRGASCFRITNAGLRESHVHDVAITRESPNYPTGAVGADRFASPWASWPATGHFCRIAPPFSTILRRLRKPRRPLARAAKAGPPITPGPSGRRCACAPNRRREGLIDAAPSLLVDMAGSTAELGIRAEFDDGGGAWAPGSVACYRVRARRVGSARKPRSVHHQPRASPPGSRPP